MAVLLGYVPLTLDNSGSGTGRNFDVVEATSDTYVLFDGFIPEAYRGMFTYDARGEADGLLNTLFISGGDRPFLEIRGLQKDFRTYANLETDPDNGQLAYLLSGDDVVIGTARPDILKGFDGNDRIVGVGGRDRLFGDAGNDRLIAGDGNDRLDGGTGIDLMQGFGGSDVYYVDNSRDRAVENAGEGTDTVVSSAHFAIRDNVEKLFLTGRATINGTGNSGDNEIRGNGGRNVLNGGDGNDEIRGGGGSDWLVGGLGDDWLAGGGGNDVLDGRFGNDLMQGGGGNDSYIVDSIYARVEEAIGGTLYGPNRGGIDTVISISSFVMPRNIENLVLAGDSMSFGIGNIEANDIRGNSAGNLLRGGWGDDFILGGGGADRIEGEGGIDRFAGGSGADVFIFRDPYDIGYGNVSETILDFERGDLLHLAAIDANAAPPGNQAFVFIGDSPFSGNGGELRYADGVLHGDHLGFGFSEFEIVFANGYDLQADDILL